MDFKDFFAKAFGKDRDSRTHAIAMLAIYAVFLIILIGIVRTGNTNNQKNNRQKPEVTNNQEVNNNDDIINNKKNNENKESKGKYEKPLNDINYSYFYTIEVDGEIETYLGKRVDDKQKFTYTKGNITLEYAIKDDNYLILKDGRYHIIDKLDGYFKYCAPDKIVNMVENLKYENEDNKYVYQLSNSLISDTFGENNKEDKNNKLELLIEDNTLKSIYLDLSNYFSSITGKKHDVNITMEFANIGTTEDFKINMN